MKEVAKYPGEKTETEKEPHGLNMLLMIILMQRVLFM